jgi:hypothetical protein
MERDRLKLASMKLNPAISVFGQADAQRQKALRDWRGWHADP